ncbi:MAG: hypothetical protein ABIY47_03155, partial [Opitutaceae bacterium]
MGQTDNTSGEKIIRRVLKETGDSFKQGEFETGTSGNFRWSAAPFFLEKVAVGGRFPEQLADAILFWNAADLTFCEGCG